MGTRGREFVILQPGFLPGSSIYTLRGQETDRSLKTLKFLPAILLEFLPQVYPVQSRGPDLGSNSLTWSADVIGQGQEWGIQGTTGVPQNRVPPVDEGHGLWVPTTLLDRSGRGSLDGGRVLLRAQKAFRPSTVLVLTGGLSHLYVPEQQLGRCLQWRLGGNHFTQGYPPALRLCLARGTEADAVFPPRHSD